MYIGVELPLNTSFRVPKKIYCTDQINCLNLCSALKPQVTVLLTGIPGRNFMLRVLEKSLNYMIIIA